MEGGGGGYEAGCGGVLYGALGRGWLEDDSSHMRGLISKGTRRCTAVGRVTVALWRRQRISVFYDGRPTRTSRGVMPRLTCAVPSVAGGHHLRRRQRSTSRP
ncbi:unnamed protein product [Chondrus crispus]|uniref:Uncharacterized protein n=1 Tax=Chondrus crispus TaxID=2769 RepID=R7QIR6_CHOCR|nr:unnamed protein product [Chondrus crispus]CDF37315.1 unnamed protein product [Chondrus crispus]|eukprot:XP_005717134.1 unnamed protein product [Chondrus crispus]